MRVHQPDALRRELAPRPRRRPLADRAGGRRRRQRAQQGRLPPDRPTKTWELNYHGTPSSSTRRVAPASGPRTAGSLALSRSRVPRASCWRCIRQVRRGLRRPRLRGHRLRRTAGRPALDEARPAAARCAEWRCAQRP